MMNKKITVALLTLLVLVTGLLTACGYTEPIAISSITLDKTSAAMYVGDELTLTATALPQNANESVSWTSGNATVASVENGKVTALAAGKTTITAKNEVGTIEAACEIIVYAKAESLAFQASTREMTVGDELEFAATVTPANGTKAIAYETSNREVVTIDENGKLTAVAYGSATITATLDGKTATCEIIVYNNVESIVLDKETALLKAEDTLQLIATITPATGTKGVTYESSNTQVATVSESGLVTAVATGSATITAKVGDKTATCEVNVLSVALTKTSLVVGLNETSALSWVVTPVTYDGELTAVYESSDQTVATVSEDGEITALKSGRTIITLTVGDMFTATCEVTVSPFKTANGITLSVGDDGALAVKANGSDETVDAFAGIAASKTYYAQVTFNAMSIVDGQYRAFGLAHSAGDTFMFDKFVGYGSAHWHRQGYGMGCADGNLTLNHFAAKMGDVLYNDIVTAYKNNGSVIVGIARNGKYAYTFVNGVIVQQVRLSAALIETDTIPALYGQQLDFGITDISCLSGADALAKINAAPKAVRYARSVDNYKPATFGDNYTTVDFNAPENKDNWHCAVTPEYIFDGNTTIEFDVKFNGTLSGGGHACLINIIKNETSNVQDQGNGLTDKNNWGDGLTVFGYKMWSSTTMNGLDTHIGAANSIWTGYASGITEAHIKIVMSMDEEGKVTSAITVTSSAWETPVTRTDVSTSLYGNEDFRILFMTNRAKYTITNLTFAPTV